MLSFGLVPLASNAEAHDLDEYNRFYAISVEFADKSQPQKSLEYLQKALTALDPVAHAREKHEEQFGKTLSFLAKSYHQCGDYPREYRALIMLRGLYRYRGQFDRLEYADCLWRLGINCDHMAKYDEGLACLEAAAVIFAGHSQAQSEAGRDRLDKISRGKGHLYLATGKLKQAEECLKDALAGTSKRYRQSAQDYGRLLLLQGDLYARQESFEKSFEAYRKSILVFKSTHPRGHIFIGQALSKFSDLLLQLDKTGAEESSPAKRENLLNSLSCSYMLKGRYFEARKILLELRDLLEKQGKKGQLRYGKCLEDLIECNVLMEDSEKGLHHAIAAAAFYKEEIKDLDSAAGCQLSVARLAARLKKEELFDKSIKEAGENIVAIHGRQSWQYGRYLVIKSLSLLRLGREKEACALLDEVVLIYQLDIEPEGETIKNKQVRTILNTVARIEDDRDHQVIWGEWLELDRKSLF